MKLIFQHKTLVSIVVSILFGLLILPFTEAIWFNTENLGRGALAYSSLLKLLFGIALAFIVYFFIHFAEQLMLKSPFYKKWLLNSLGYSVILGIILLLIFPGYWVWDEFFVLSQSEVYAVHSWQHIFTQLQYVFSLYLIPSSTGITLIQLGFIAAVTGYVLAIVQSLTKNKWLWVLTIIPFISFPVLLGNFYTLRLHVYGYILLLLLLGVILLYKNKRPATPQYAKFFGFIVLLTLLAFWRSEGVIYLITLPFIAYRLNIIQISTIQRSVKTVAVALASVAILISGYLATSLTEESHYKLTATINPLSILVHQDLRGEKIDEAWDQVGTVLNLEVLRQFPSYTDIPSAWRSQPQSVFQPNYEQHLGTYYKGLSYILLNNPDTYLATRIKTFLATNSLDQQHVSTSEGWLTPYTLAGCTYITPEHCDRVGQFAESNRFNNSLNAELRKDTIYFLLQQNVSAPYYNFARILIWNIIPVLIILLAILFYTVFTRKWLCSGIAVLLFAHTALVFISAPANFFMYYFPIYLVGVFLSCLLLVMEIDKRITRKGAKV